MTVSENLIDDRNEQTTVAQRAFRILVGRWRLDRTIPGVASLVGQAVFAPTGNALSPLRYQERGDLRLNAGGTYAATRRYLYRLMGERIVIEFADRPNRGAALHDLSFNPSPNGAAVLVARHRHSCWPDNYDFEMTIRGNDRLETRYRIVGPRKNYEMHTIYDREPARIPDPGQMDL
jgi:uncharacterized protein DUF6314